MLDERKELYKWLNGIDRTISSPDDVNLVCYSDASSIPEDFAVDVVYGGAFSIKGYYMESGNPRQMRGASQLLLDASKKYSQHAYFTCGLESFLIVKHGSGKEVARNLENTFREKTLTAQAVAVWRSATVKELLDENQFKKLWACLNKAFAERRMLVFLPLELPENKVTNESHYIFPHNDTSRCSRCNYRESAYIAKMDKRYEGEFLLCPVCAYREDRGSYLLRTGYKYQCMEFGKINMSIEWRVEKDEEQKEDKFWSHGTKDIADVNGDFALLYADINNLGGVGKSLSGTVSKRKHFCEAVQDTVKEALYKAISIAVPLSKAKEDGKKPQPRAKFEIIAMGGDDICVLLPGEVALAAGTLLLREFDKNWKIKHIEEELPQLTISAGIAIGKATTPIAYMHKATEQLLKLAKEKAQENNCSCVDILSLNNDGQWAVEIKKKLRKNLKKQEGNKTALLTMRPFTVSEAEKMLRCLQEFNISSSTLYNIAEASLRCGISEGDLWFRYLLARQTKDDESLKTLAGEYNCDMYFAREGKTYSPWRDLAELRDQKWEVGL